MLERHAEAKGLVSQEEALETLAPAITSIYTSSRTCSK